MTRGVLGAILIACTVLVFANEAQAIERRDGRPPRVRRGSYAEYISPRKTGLPYTRQVYSGYRAGFPPPAFLYYGYPHSGDDTGIGPLEWRQ